ncbi:MAG: Ldh family oxidoreductase [Pseudomonadota bacterium]
MTERETIPLEEVDLLVRRALEKHGASAAQAAAVARIVTAAERDGSESHGLFRVPGYVASLRSGKVDGSATPSLSQTAPGVVAVDAARGFAPLALELGLPALVDRARETGIAALAIRQCFHFAALWPEVERIAEAGLVGLAVTAATPMVAPAGGTRPFFGTNPIAFAFPRVGAPPLAFDMATAAMARGDIMLHARDGEALPPGVGIGPDGEPSTDPDAVLAGAQLPFGGYKGAAISLMVELLAGAVAGDLFSFEAGAKGPKDGGPPEGGELLIAIDPGRFGHGDGWQARAEGFFSALTAIEGTRLPGARRHANRSARGSQGAPVPTALLAEVRRLAGPDA